MLTICARPSSGELPWSGFSLTELTPSGNYRSSGVTTSEAEMREMEKILLIIVAMAGAFHQRY
jgi:hypothetical protein